MNTLIGDLMNRCLRLLHRPLVLLFLIFTLTQATFAHPLTANMNPKPPADAICPTFPYTVPAGDVAALINAITCANSNGAGTNDVINLTDGVFYSVNAPDNNTDGANGLPVIVDAAVAGTLTINGNGADILRDNGTGMPEFRLLNIAPGGNLTLNDVSIVFGDLSTGAFNGGGILNHGTLTLWYSGVSSSSAGGAGGGIYNDGGTLTVIRGSFYMNSATDGGGIYNANGTLTILSSLLKNHSVANRGGGVYSAGGALAITNSTFGHNDAYQGGGVYSDSPVATVANSTFSDNSALADQGGGNLYNAENMTVTNSIIANRVSGGDCRTTGAFFSASYSLIEDGSCGITNGVNGNRTGDPILGTLANNGGGSTQTFAPQAGSPAINGGSTALIPADTFDLDDDGDTAEPLPYDQRGAGFPRVYSDAVDMGAHETDLTIVPTLLQVDTLSSENLQACTIQPNDCSLRGAINWANANPGADTITFGVMGTIALDSSNRLPNITSVITIVGPGTPDQLTVSGGDSARILLVGNGGSLTLSGVTLANALGGAIRAEGSGMANIFNARIVNNRAAANLTTGTGGAVIAVGGNITITDSVISGNRAGYGGAIYATNNGRVTLVRAQLSDHAAGGVQSVGGTIYSYDGRVTLIDTTITGSTAETGGAIRAGGTSQINIIGSTIRDSTATNAGGAIYNEARLNVINSTITGNSAPTGGGIYTTGAVIVELTNITVVGNTATTGGGIYRANGTLTIENTALANNGGGNCGGVTGGSSSLSTDATCGFGAGDNVDPLLGTLGNHGGATETYLPLYGSPAINAGNSALLPSDQFDLDGDGVTAERIPYEQRGAGYPRVIAGAVDIGAVETNYPHVVPPTLSAPSGTITEINPTFRWTPIGVDGAWYHLWIEGESGYVGDPWFEAWGNCSATECAVTPALNLPLGVYRWWLQYWTPEIGYSPWSDPVTFTVDVPIDRAILFAPSGDTANPTPQFTWQGRAGHSWYYLWISGPEGHILDQWYENWDVCSGNICSVIPPLSLPGGTYTWWVQMWTPDAGYAAWSDPLVFRVTLPPAAPTQFAPMGTISTAAPTFTWSSVPAGSWYYLWLSGESGHVLDVWYSAANCAGGMCSVTPPLALPDGAYRWWVQAWSSEGGYGGWSAGTDFAVNVATLIYEDLPAVESPIERVPPEPLPLEVTPEPGE